MSLAGLGFKVMRPLLHRLDAEQAHRATLKALALLPHGAPPAADPHLSPIEVMGLRFPNPLGLAAGFDKNAEVPDAMLAMGFGFIEVGTVTPRPQEGNPRPRLFRLTGDGAVINRMGFNNGGHAAARARLTNRQGRGGIIGINLGANKDSGDRIADYVAGIAAFAPIASYITINVSSPNTPGLRALQSRAELQSLLRRLNDARARASRHPPMLLKIAPDLGTDELEDIARCCAEGAVDGIIVANTTISRPPLVSPESGEVGGLSGAPLFTLSTRKLAELYLLTEGRIPLIGVGGIASAEQAWIKLCAGASLLQLYSCLVYRGPDLVGEILAGLSQRLVATGARSLSEVTGKDAAGLAHQGASGT